VFFSEHSVDCVDVAGCSSARGRQTKVGYRKQAVFELRQCLENGSKYVKNYY